MPTCVQVGIFFYICSMKIISICSIISFVLLACNSSISNAPALQYVNAGSFVDTVKEDSIVPLQFKITADDAPLRLIQLKQKKTILFDTILSNIYDFEYTYNTSFFGLKGLQTIELVVYDTEDLYSSVSKQYYVQELISPKISFDSTGVFADTIVKQQQPLHFSIRCTRGERNLDSLYIYHNSIKTYSYPQANATLFADSVHIIPYTYTFSKVGSYVLLFTLVDVAQKTVGKQIKITVIE